MTDPSRDVDLTEDSYAREEFKSLMADIGYLLFYWSLLEIAVIDETRHLRIAGGDSGDRLARTRGSFSERLAEWRALVTLKSRRNPEIARAVNELSTRAEGLHRKRDVIALHFLGISGDDGEVAIHIGSGGFSSSKAQQATLTKGDLDEMINDMNDCRRGIVELRHSL